MSAVLPPSLEGELTHHCTDAGVVIHEDHRIASILCYGDASEACNAAFVGGPVALAWSRFDEAVRARVRLRYLESIELWRNGSGYRIPGEFVIVAGSKPCNP